MRNYEKPMILANEELAEGVYAASGASTEASTVGVQVNYLNGWDKYVQYNVVLTNNASEAITSCTVKLQFSGDIGNVSYWGSGTATYSGSVLTIDWSTPYESNAIAANGGTTSFSMQVDGASSQVTYVKTV